MEHKNDKELFSVKGKNVLITGANSGLGKAMAFGFRGAGACVFGIGRNEEKNKKMIDDGFHFFTADVCNDEAIKAVIDQIIEDYNCIDVIINNAGIFRSHRIIDIDHKDWDYLINTNLRGVYICSKLCAASMIKCGHGGKIINIGSIYSDFGHPASAGYSTSKTAILGFTRSIACELGPYNIQANTIIPGWFRTDMNDGVPESERGEDIRRRTPCGRWGIPEDIVGTAIFLSSSASNFISGSAIYVDGGYSISDRWHYE